jgi:putative oxidoreductase
VRAVLWLLQVLLCLFFLSSGAMKLFQPYEVLAAQMTWVGDVPPWLVLVIGLTEVLGAIGLVLPAATRVLPWLTPLAAAGLALEMLLATLFHLSRGEVTMAPVPLVFGLLSTFVAFGRHRLAPIQPRVLAPDGA